MKRRWILAGLAAWAVGAAPGQNKPDPEKLAPYYPTPEVIVEKMLQIGGLKAGEKMFQILLAEDNLVNQRVAQRVLEKAGHRVVIASNGREAIELLEQRHFDLILMDVQMPEIDGFEATAAIRERERDTGVHIPIIAMTAHAMTGDRERCIEAGMDAYISKPLDVAVLLDAVARLSAAHVPA